MLKSHIDPNELFNKEILDYQVQTANGSAQYVNLDNAATTPPLKAVEDGIRDYIQSYGSVHRGAGIKSQISTDRYEASRDTIRDFVNAPKDSYVLFTQNTTGAMNTVAHFFSFLEGKVAVSAIEHSSSWLPWIKSEGIKALGSRSFTIDELDSANEDVQKLGREQVLRYDVNDEFEFDLDSIETLLRDNKVKALVLTASSNLNGYCPDIKAIGNLTHKYGAKLIVDACQFIQHHPIDMQEMGIDFLAASGHKFYAPYGGGFLIGPKNFLDKFLPYQIGGGNLPYITEDGTFLRYRNQLAHDPGTPNAIGAVSMDIALQKIRDVGINNIAEYERVLTRKLFDALSRNPQVNVYVNEKHLSTVVPFNIKGMNASEVAERLSRDSGIGIRAGSFCVYHALRKLLMIKDERQIISDVINGEKSRMPMLARASVGLCNTEEDIDRITTAISHLTA